MYKIDPTVSTLSITGAVALGLSLVLNMAAPSVAQQVSSISASSAHAADSAALRPAWAASATGRIEPKDGEIRIDATVLPDAAQREAATRRALDAFAGFNAQALAQIGRAHV